MTRTYNIRVRNGRSDMLVPVRPEGRQHRLSALLDSCRFHMGEGRLRRVGRRLVWERPCGPS